jgi:16S rRNA (guanine527-N7)-methyltransferase
LRQDRERILALLNVSRETSERLDAYLTLLMRWQKAVNLVASSTLGSLWTRHVLDSAQIAEIGAHHSLWADIGSGAGFPGMVLAILAMEKSKPGTFHLVESDRRKASFLREAARVTGAPAVIHACRAEVSLPSLAQKVTAITARALAPLPRLLALAEPLLTTGSEGFFPKGETLSLEMEQALELFAFESRTMPSRSDEKGLILVIRDLRRRAASVGDFGDRK